MPNLELIKKVREQTGAGMMEVKKALEEAKDDEQKAMEILRKSGAAKAAKKAGRSATEGLINIESVPDHKKASIIQINCETDFVAKNEIFINFVSKLSAKNMEPGEAKKEFESNKEDMVLKIGENIVFGNADTLAGEYVSNYLHPNKKVGALILFNKEVPEELAHEIAMHVAASNPLYLKPEDAPADVLEKEKEIYREQLAKENKPENIMEKIIQGKLNKYYQENCLLKQIFVKDDKKSIEQLLPDGVEIVKFIRYSL